MTEIQVVLDGKALPPWTGTPGSLELQEVPGVEGVTVSFVNIYGILEPGDFFGVLEVSGHCRGMMSHRVSRVDLETACVSTTQLSRPVLRYLPRLSLVKYTLSLCWRAV